MLRTCLSTLIAAAALLAPAMAPPLIGEAKAATWSDDLFGDPTYTGITHELTTPSTGQTTAIRFFYRSDGTPDWLICQQIDTDDSTTAFDSNNCGQFRGGNAFSNGAGVAYKAPTSIGTSTLSIRWRTSLTGNFVTFDRALIGTYYLSTDEALLLTTLTRTVVSAGRPAPHLNFANFPASYWWDSSRSGSGLFLEFQGTSALMLFYGYAGNGQAEWRIATGAMTDATNGSFSFNRCTKSGSTVTCSPDGGNVTLQLVNNSTFPALSYIVVTYPSGRVETLSRYRF